jgi:SAM-dependent methyltransferase
LTNGKQSTWEEAVLWLRDQPDQGDLVRACFYDDPLLVAAHRYYESSEWQAVREFLPKRVGAVLDIGAGRGVSSYALARDGWETTALEPDPSPIVGAGAIRALSIEANLSIRVEETWGEVLPFSDESFDVVHGRQVLHHAKDLTKLCREAARVLKRNGLFIATREHVLSRHGDLPIFLENHPLHKRYGGENAYLLTEYLAAIQQGGITLMHVLNPFQSEINFYPDTLGQLKNRLAHKVLFPWPHLIPNLVLGWMGTFMNTPGRLYTFVAKKAANV